MSVIRIHKEGHRMLGILLILLILIAVVVAALAPTYTWIVTLTGLVFFVMVLQFFRNPQRPIPRVDDRLVYAPADGKVVVIESTKEEEYFGDERQQVSIFMSPVNVHVNRSPVSGEVTYYKYHPGKYLVAWHPKSSTENERTTTVIKTGGTEILMRQIAGALAKRIKNYLRVGEAVEQGVDIGFIKFGSRVDLFLPMDAQLEVDLEQMVKGNKTVIARLQ